ncbi:MAG: protein kinase [Myxococcota bacterium]
MNADGPPSDLEIEAALRDLSASGAGPDDARLVEVVKRLVEAERFQEAYALADRYGRPDLAARVAEGSGDIHRAAEYCEQAGDPERAADLWVAALAGQARTRLDRASAAQACRRAADLYAHIGKLDRAVQVLRWGGDLAHAAGMLAQNGRHDEARRMFLELGDLLSAADVARRAGDQRGHHELLARHAEREGRLLDAAEHYMEAQVPFEAVRLFELGGDTKRAAVAASRGELWDTAARLYERLGDFDAAVGCLERAGRAEEAQMLRTRVQAKEPQIAERARAARYLEAAVGVLARARAGDNARYEEAIRYLEQVTPDSSDHLAARTMLGEVLAERGETKRAIAVLQDLFVGVAPTPAHVPAMYQYGRLLEREGYLAGARNAYRTVSAFEPEHRDVALRLERLRESDRSPFSPRDRHTPTPYAGPMVFAGGAVSFSEITQDLSIPGFQSTTLPPVAVSDLVLSDATNPVPPRTNLHRRSSSPDELLGTVLRDRFRLERRIGRGAQAQVYLSRDQVLDREVAIKVLSDGLEPDDTALARFLREARLAARVRHANCLAIYDFGHEAGLTFIAMEYFKGRTLRELVKKGPLGTYLALRIARDVAAALGAVHEAGIVHRDVKPTNVMVDKSAQVRLTDFGVARLVSDDSQAGMMVGTMKYMAPEQARGKDADTRADIFSLGAMLYEMLAGQAPYGGTLDALIRRVNKPPPELPPELDLRKEIRDLVRTCMQRRPEHRFESVEVLFEALNRCIGLVAPDRRRAQS